MRYVAEKKPKSSSGQKNFWLPDGLKRQLDGLVAKINKTAKPRTGPSEIVGMALDELFKQGEVEVRKMLAGRRNAGVLGNQLSRDLKRAAEDDPGEHGTPRQSAAGKG